MRHTCCWTHITDDEKKRIVLWFSNTPSTALLTLLRVHASYARFDGSNYGWFVQRGSWPKLLAALQQHSFDDLASRVRDCMKRWEISDAEEAEGGRTIFLSARDLPRWWQKNRKKRR